MKSVCLGLAPVVVMAIHTWVLVGHIWGDTAVLASEVATVEDTEVATMEDTEAGEDIPRDAGVPTVAAAAHVKVWGKDQWNRS